MGRRERNAMAAVDLGEREVADALIARVIRDRAEDERTLADRPSTAPPLDRLTILGRVAKQREAATGEWVRSGRLQPQKTPQAKHATGSAAERSDRASAAAIAARLHDRQRGG